MAYGVFCGSVGSALVVSFERVLLGSMSSVEISTECKAIMHMAFGSYW